MHASTPYEDTFEPLITRCAEYCEGSVLCSLRQTEEDGPKHPFRSHRQRQKHLQERHGITHHAHTGDNDTRPERQPRQPYPHTSYQFLHPKNIYFTSSYETKVIL